MAALLIKYLPPSKARTVHVQTVISWLCSHVIKVNLKTNKGTTKTSLGQIDQDCFGLPHYHRPEKGTVTWTLPVICLVSEGGGASSFNNNSEMSFFFSLGVQHAA